MDTFNQLDSPFGMHPDMKKVPGIEMSTGSLGHGISVALGLALAGRLNNASWRVYCLMGDGELNEGIVWEAAMAASHFKLGNLVAIVDRNYLMMDGDTEKVMQLEPLEEKWKAFRWNVQTIDGHDYMALLDALEALPPAQSHTPTILIAKTVKGCGVECLENFAEWHYGNLDESKTQEVLNELEAKRAIGRVS